MGRCNACGYRCWRLPAVALRNADCQEASLDTLRQGKGHPRSVVVSVTVTAMDTQHCQICSRPFTLERPLLRVPHADARKSPKHAWRTTDREIRLCVACATARHDELPPDVLVRSGIQAFITDAHRTMKCLTCRTPVAVPPDARRKYAYCSERCRAALYREHVDRVERPCGFCGAPMTGRSDRRFCSTRCRVAAHRTAKP